MSGEHVSSLSSSGSAERPTGTQPAAAQQPAGQPASDQPSQPVDLRLVALAPGGTHLVLEDCAAQQFRVPVDERLAATLRSTTRHRARPGQLEIALESQLSPREIQARIRAGRSVDEVSLAAGISTERVERYAVPVMAERIHVVEQAQRTPGRRASGGSAPALQDLVERRLAEQKAAPDAAEWDAWRADDEERWTVRLSYLAGGRARTATWTFDPRGRVLSPADDEARWLADEPGTERLADVPPAAVRRLTSVPGPDTGDTGDTGAGEVGKTGEPGQVVLPRVDEVYDREADEVAAGAGALPARGAARGRRPPVPSWDDIMFGTRKRD